MLSFLYPHLYNNLLKIMNMMQLNAIIHYTHCQHQLHHLSGNDAIKIGKDYMCTFMCEYKKLQVTQRITCNLLTLSVPNGQDNTNVLFQF